MAKVILTIIYSSVYVGISCMETIIKVNGVAIAKYVVSNVANCIAINIHT